MQKLNVIDKSCHYSEIAQRVYKCSDAQHISLTAEEEQNSLTYGTLVCLNIGPYTGVTHLKTVRYFCPPCTILISSSAMADRPCDCLRPKSPLCSCQHCQWFSAGRDAAPSVECIWNTGYTIRSVSHWGGSLSANIWQGMGHRPPTSVGVRKLEWLPLRVVSKYPQYII